MIPPLKVCSLLATITILSPLASGAVDTAGNLIPDAPTASNPGDWANEQWGVGLSASTLGLGGHVRYDTNNKFYLKADIQGLAIDETRDIDGTDYDGELDFFSAGLTGNYLPFADSKYAKGFKLSFGGFLVDNNIKIEASEPGRVISIGASASYTLQAGDSLTGEINNSSFAPYIGLGWDWSWGSKKQYVLSLDAGVLFTGSPDVSLTPNSTLLANSSIPQAQFDAEAQNIIDDLDEFEIFPVVKLGFTWKF
jgi:hypothetical protein